MAIDNERRFNLIKNEEQERPGQQREMLRNDAWPVQGRKSHHDDLSTSSLAPSGKAFRQLLSPRSVGSGRGHLLAAE